MHQAFTAINEAKPVCIGKLIHITIRLLWQFRQCGRKAQTLFFICLRQQQAEVFFMKSNISIDYDTFFHLPHTRAEGDWMEDRLKTLSATETIILAGALQQNRPETAVDAINLLATLNEYCVRFPATDIESLAQFYFAQNSLKLPDLVLKHTHMEPLGIAFQDEHPGVFVADYYVMEPADPTRKTYDGHNLDDIKDWSWNVKIRLTSLKKV